MAAALALGWSSEGTGPDSIVVSDVDSERAGSLADRTGASTADSNRELAEQADVLVLATKPAALGSVAEETRVTVHEQGIPVVSILGAVPTTAIEQAYGEGTRDAALHAQRRGGGPRRHLLLRARLHDRRRDLAQPPATCSACSASWSRWRSG